MPEESMPSREWLERQARMEEEMEAAANYVANLQQSFDAYVAPSGMLYHSVLICDKCGHVESDLYMVRCPNGHLYVELGLTPHEISLALSRWN
jgi:hypothetical protein